jgi:hypothetical protein
MKDVPPQEGENAKLLHILNSIILREYTMFRVADEAQRRDYITVLETSARMGTCGEIAQRMGLTIVEPLDLDKTDEGGKDA